VRAATEQGRFEQIFGNVTRIERGRAGLAVNIELLNGSQTGPLDVTGVVCGTGFVKSALSLPLLRRLAQDYGVPIHRERIRLKTNCGVPPLDRPDSRMAMMGINANTVVPNGDTIAGLKYIARRFVGDVVVAENPKARSFPSRLRMQLGLARATAQALRHIRTTEQIA
jgi:hypothetical protein